MSFVLQDAEALTLRVDCWTWGAFHAAVSAARILPAETWAPLRFNGGGALAAAEALRLAAFVEAVLLPFLRPGERLLLDGRVTCEREGSAPPIEESEVWRAYSLSFEALSRILAFLKAARGNVTVD